MARAVAVTAGPIAAAVTTNICASQKAAGAQQLVLNGALADATANNICLSQTPSVAGNLTLNGSLSITPAGATAAVAYISSAFSNVARRVYITSVGNDSGITFTVTGTVFGGSGPASVVETVTGSNASVVSTSNVFATVTKIAISAAAAAAVTVGANGIATTDLTRRVRISSGGNDSGITFTVSGTDWNGSLISETITGSNGSTADSVLDYATVTSIKTSGAVATTVTIGTNGVCTSPWVRLDNLGAMAPTALQCTASGTVNFTVQQTLDDPTILGVYQSALGSAGVAMSSMTWVNHPDSNLVSATATVQGNYAYPPVFCRVVLNSGTGSVKMTVQQNYQG